MRTSFLLCAVASSSLWIQSLNGYAFHGSRIIPVRTHASSCFSSRLWMTGTSTGTEVGNQNQTMTMFGSGIRNGQSTHFLQPDWLQDRHHDHDLTSTVLEIPRPTQNGGYSHTSASKAKISAANKGRTPWNKGKERSEEAKARIAAGVRKRNRENFLLKLKEMGITEEEFTAQKANEEAAKEAERRARKTENGGYRPTEETKRRLSEIIKSKWASGEVKRRTVDPAKVRRGFTHSAETRAKISESVKKLWSTDDEYRNNVLNKTMASNRRDDVRQRISDSLRKKWEDPDFRANMTARIATRSPPTASHGQSHREKIAAKIKAKWQDEDYRKKATEAMQRRQAELTKARPPRPTTISSKSKPKPTIAKQVLPRPTNMLVSPTDPVLRGSGAQLAQPVPERKTKIKGVQKQSAVTKPTEVAGSNGLEIPIAVAAQMKKKFLIEKTTVVSVDGSLEATPSGLQPATPKSIAKTTVKEKEGPGSVTRLREERRDLYDLLYGDEDADEDERSKENRGSVLPTTTDHGRLSSIFLEDEDLDDYDPYGLEDF